MLYAIFKKKSEYLGYGYGNFARDHTFSEWLSTLSGLGFYQMCIRFSLFFFDSQEYYITTYLCAKLLEIL